MGTLLISLSEAIMNKERMIALLDEQIVLQNRVAYESANRSIKKEHQHMRSGLVLAKVILRENWDEQADKR